nr:hypothetical protein HUO10_001193 [Paraburkholderia busanensis]
MYTASRFHRDAARGRVLLMPDWEGMNSGWAQEIGRLYSQTCDAEVIVTDHYGQHRPHPGFDEAAYINQQLYRDTERSRSIFRGMVAALQAHWQASGPLVVVGFCSGGAFSFETGRSGAAVDAVFCVHGDPRTIDPIDQPGDYPVFTVVHGEIDPFVPQSSLDAFAEEMRAHRIRWNLHIISDAKHSFTRFDNRRSGYGIAYSKRAEIETRHLVAAQILSLIEANATR